jgi:hypothetical protein
VLYMYGPSALSLWVAVGTGFEEFSSSRGLLRSQTIGKRRSERSAGCAAGIICISCEDSQ